MAASENKASTWRWAMHPSSRDAAWPLCGADGGEHGNSEPPPPFVRRQGGGKKWAKLKSISSHLGVCCSLVWGIEWRRVRPSDKTQSSDMHAATRTDQWRRKPGVSWGADDSCGALIAIRQRHNKHLRFESQAGWARICSLIIRCAHSFRALGSRGTSPAETN